MNKYDSELVSGILRDNDFDIVDDVEDADAILVNTCAVREHAENRALNAIKQLKHLKVKKPELILGVLGCMSKHLGNKIIQDNRYVDIVLGPDAYRRLPELLRERKKCEDILTRENEDYGDIFPLHKEGVCAWVAISRGCNEECSYCIVPYTRGKERSRPVQNIIDEIKRLINDGFKEVTLLGQNVNSYNFDGIDFPKLLERVSDIEGLKRIRFATSHPMNLSDRLIDIMSERENVCSNLHLPVQSGSNKILSAMKRNYTAEHYIYLIEKAKSKIKDLAVTSDFLSGFPGETKNDHKQTIELIKKVGFDNGFSFKYSPRDKTEAFKYKDDVPEDVKIERLEEISEFLRELALKNNRECIGKTMDIMIEGKSRRSDEEIFGKTDGFKKVILKQNNLLVGTFAKVFITDATSQTLFGKIV
jgi:tRNA-2-methylthio-N6-dimethylallyladenosine synthase